MHSRSQLVLGENSTDILHTKTVMLLGVGGVGSYALEALARSGIGRIIIVDGDEVSESNLNRQLLALRSTVGRSKVVIAAERIADIDPQIEVQAINRFVLPENIEELPIDNCDCVLDAIDTVGTKLALAEWSAASGVPLISCMGTGNKLDPSQFVAADIFATHGCPLARIMRSELKKRGVTKLRVIYSPEPPCNAVAADSSEGRHSPGSVPFVPGAAGLLMAAEAVKLLLNMK